MPTRAVTGPPRRATSNPTTLPSKATDSNLTRHKDTPRAHHRYVRANASSKPNRTTDRIVLQQQMVYQQQPPRQKKDRGCLGACLATLCCCFLCEETCECCFDCIECCEMC
ncbi:hypothetical protein BDV06DRAFT_191030 [Aspergillus oleicola]